MVYYFPFLIFRLLMKKCFLLKLRKTYKSKFLRIVCHFLSHLSIMRIEQFHHCLWPIFPKWVGWLAGKRTSFFTWISGPYEPFTHAHTTDSIALYCHLYPTFPGWLVGMATKLWCLDPKTNFILLLTFCCCCLMNQWLFLSERCKWTGASNL